MGDGDGVLAIDATLSRVSSIVVDSSKNLFLADEGTNLIREITTNGVLSTYSGRGPSNGPNNVSGVPALGASIFSPTHLTRDQEGDLYFAEPYTIRLIGTTGGCAAISEKTLRYKAERTPPSFFLPPQCLFDRCTSVSYTKEIRYVYSGYRHSRRGLHFSDHCCFAPKRQGGGSGGCVRRYGISDCVRAARVGNAALQGDHDFRGYLHVHVLGAIHFVVAQQWRSRNGVGEERAGQEIGARGGCPGGEAATGAGAGEEVVPRIAVVAELADAHA